MSVDDTSALGWEDTTVLGGEDIDSTSTQIPEESTRRIDAEETFWEVHTGLIVLEAEGKYFCAQRSVLCEESRIFRDMFAIPQPLTMEASEQYEGKPLVRLQDRAKELQFFLKALHHYRRFYLSPASRSVAAKAAILRLSSKYEVSHLRKRTIKEISSYFPTSLATFNQGKVVEMSDQELELLISAVEEAGARRFLPAIKYHQCKRVSLSKVYSGETVCTVSSAIPALIMRQFEIRHMVASTGDSCPDRKASGRYYQGSCTQFMETCFRKSMSKDQLDPLSESPIYADRSVTAERGPHSQYLCRDCEGASRRSFEEKRQKLWDDLPRIFGLPPWEELLKEH